MTETENALSDEELLKKLHLCGDWAIGYFWGNEFVLLATLTDDQRTRLLDGVRERNELHRHWK